MVKPHILLAQSFWEKHLHPGDLAIDMTCGNGHDTLFLTNLQATVYAFDIQQSAIQNTKALAPSAITIHRSHDELDQTPLPASPRLIIYNLGYLPGGDKSIVTKRESTIKSLRQAMGILAPQGAISMMCYPGHEEGLEEEKEVLEFVKGLCQKQWTVSFHQWINRAKAPSLVWLYRKRLAS